MFVALLMVGCGESTKPAEGVDMTDTAPKKDALETAVDWSKLQDRSGVTYLPNTDKPFSGNAKRAYENEQVGVLAEFKDGYVVRLKQWLENGTPRWDVGYMEGKVGVDGMPWSGVKFVHAHGSATIWHRNGQKEEESNWKDGKKNGLMTLWHKNGQKEGEGNWKEGYPVGLWTYWYGNGQKEEEGNLKDGEQDGLWVFYNEDGTEGGRRTYKDGVKVED